MGQGGAGWGQGLLILIPEETYNTCNFTGGGGVSGSPNPHLSMESRESVEPIDSRRIYGCSIRAAS